MDPPKPLTLMSWAQMDFKQAKSRSLVVRKGNITDKFCFFLGGVQIPSITKKPVNSLGKVFNSTLRDTAILHETGKEIHAWIAAVDRSRLPGKFKAWIYQHGNLLRLLATASLRRPPNHHRGFERKISHSLHRWLNLSSSISSITLYGKGQASMHKQDGGVATTRDVDLIGTGDGPKNLVV